MAWSQSHLLGYMQGTCHAPLPPDNDRNSLYRKPLRTGGSAEGRPRANGAVRTGSQLPADWHAPRCLTARIVMPPRDGARLLSPGVDNGARLLYI